VGVIGLGRSGWELHCAALPSIGGFRLAAVCDRSEARRAAAARAFGVRTYDEVDALIDDREIDLVVVSTPTNTHAQVAIAALDHGKHVLVEKPMGVCLDDADAMINAARRAGRVLTVFHNRHWDRDYQAVKRLVEGDVLGRLMSVESRVMTYGPEWASYGVPEFVPNWRTRLAYGGGFLADWGPHLLEQILDLTAQWPLGVTCELRSQMWATEVEDYFHVRLAFPSGLVVTVEAGNSARLPSPRWFIVGSDGTLVADGRWGRWTEMRARRDLAGIDADLVLQGIGRSSGSGNLDVNDELSKHYYEDLAGAILARRPPAVTLQRAYDVMVLLDAARRSSRQECTVRLGPRRLIE
jgi:predicted dehydrogenase